MKTFVPSLLVFVLVSTSLVFAIEDRDEQLLFDRALLPGEVQDDIPIRGRDAGLRGDSTWYGQYVLVGEEYYAIPFDNKAEGSWTFDRGTGPTDPPPPLIDGAEGWSASDRTVNEETYFRVIDETLDLGPGVPSPIIAGLRSLWVGVDKQQADSLCYECGAGYGNDWNQRCRSGPLSYNGSGGVLLSFQYWCFLEPCYEGVQVYLKRADGSELMLNPYPEGECPNNSSYTGGIFTDSIGHYTDPATYTRAITAGEIGEAQEIEIVFEFTSDAGWSDEDCDYPTIWGPFCVDNITISGGGISEAYDFETGLQGWEPGVGTPIGSYAGLADVGCYTILDACGCRLEGNILELHGGLCNDGFHPEGQSERLMSPICVLGGSSQKDIFMEFDMYAEMPQENGVLHRPGWLYYPYTCEVTGATTWSPRVGQSPWNYVGDDPVCGTWRYGGTVISSGIPVPPDAEMVIAILEVVADCEQFSIDPCSGTTNFTPIYDNITVCETEGVAAPKINFDTGRYLQDVGSHPSTLFDPRAPGPANTVFDNNMNTPPGTAPDVCGDTLVVVGPQPTYPDTRWEARMWWRIAKRAPLQSDYDSGVESRYKIWKDRVSDGKLIDRPYNPEFASGWMDSVQVGHVVTRNKFKATFREDDDDFVGEELEENEILWDDVFYPGTRLQYFITSNYVSTPNVLYHLPDTSGGFFYEMEILPGLRTANVPDCGGAGFHYCVFQPATLYIDAYGRGGQLFIENTLRTILHGLDPCLDELGCEIPRDRAWDRYDYGDPSSCWNAGFMRGSVVGSNNGMTLNQVLGYRTILINTGTIGQSGMEDTDFSLFDQWLTAPDCNSNMNRQLFIMNGDKAGELLEDPGCNYGDGHGPAFLDNRLGAALLCDEFNGSLYDPDCGDVNTSYCVRLLPSDGGAFGTDIDIDAYGNYCPNDYGFNVYSLNGGIGNRYYYAEDGLKEMSYAQVTNEDLSAEANYRTVLCSPSWHHMTARDAGGTGMDLCPRDLPSIVAACIAEIGAAMKWGFDVSDYESIPKLADAKDLAYCQGTGFGPSGVNDGASTLPVNRLLQNQPNPFNPTTTIRFQTAQAGHVEIAIHDVGGRLVKTLVDEKLDAGLHSIVWNGTNDLGRRVGSGIYWSQMRTDKYVSNKKVVVLK